MVLTQLLVYLCLVPPPQQYYRDFGELFMLMLATAFIGAAGYIINDYFDVKIDAVNKPHRLIIDRHIKRRWAMVFHHTFNVLAVAIGVYISWFMAGLFILIIFLLWQYSASLKCKLVVGNVVVSLMLAATIVVVMVMEPAIHRGWAYFYAGFAFFTSWMREIIKDVEDMKGDSEHRCETVPVRLGVVPTKNILEAALIVITGIVLAFVLSFAWDGYLLLAFCFLLLDAAFAYAAWLVSKADKKIDFRKLSTVMKYIMLFGILTMTVVRYEAPYT